MLKALKSAAIGAAFFLVPTLARTEKNPELRNADAVAEQAAFPERKVAVAAVQFRRAARAVEERHHLGHLRHLHALRRERADQAAGEHGEQGEIQPAALPHHRAGHQDRDRHAGDAEDVAAARGLRVRQPLQRQDEAHRGDQVPQRELVGAHFFFFRNISSMR